MSDILSNKGVELGNLDRTEPPLSTYITGNTTIKVIRVREEFIVQQSDILFSREIIKNGAIPEGETILIQSGTKGIQEVTTRLVYEDNINISDSIVEIIILQESLPEIIMVGVKNLDLGKIVYLSSGTAWVIANPKDPINTRNPVVTTGDLDGRIFLMSPDGKWLLFTRKSTKPASEEINTLWVKNLLDKNSPIIDLHISNIVHFASFVPQVETTISYSTVEPHEAAPGWQANNDLYTVKFSAFGAVDEPIQIIEPNSGGIYGWWGTNFIWSQNGKILAYARPDGVGKVNFNEKTFDSFMEIVPLQTHSDWALISGLSWSPDSKYVYFVSHNTTSTDYSPEESPFFDISIFSLEDNSISNIKNTGMFAYPTASPYRVLNGNITVQIAYLQSEDTEQSDTSQYRLYTMDEDGSNKQAIFPMLENAHGLEPQQPVWSPGQIGQDNLIAIIYEGNIWLLDLISGESNKITSDGLVVILDWK